MVETDKKRDVIIEGAIKRFIHYGINKTTMNEIAEDLSVSKPSLYYYFPDKNSKQKRHEKPY
jgi:AcrR family transcriptional regulator